MTRAPQPPKPLEPVHLSAGRLYLRPLIPADEAAIAVGLRDADVMRWNAGLAIIAAPEQQRAAMWLRVREQGWAAGVAANFAVTDAITGALLATVGIRDIHRAPQQALASYWTMPEARGRGIAAQALDVVCRWGFGAQDTGGLGLHRISLDHSLTNPASCRVAEKSGFALEGVMRGSFVDYEGNRYDSHLHARLATDPQPELPPQR